MRRLRLEYYWGLADAQQQQHVLDVDEQRPALIAKPKELTPRDRSLET
ncbi:MULTISPECIES: hypothetical protein [unclassified Pseudoalteromonas]|nr:MULTISPECIES: hypothetical protein [Gammaproteobacteria]MCF7517593.1 hypothetical protein [Pseudoalteromonas sp. L21]UJX25255.1 hypothetical protein L3Q70_14925 [Pseudoalteromonas sp. CF6-2]